MKWEIPNLPQDAFIRINDPLFLVEHDFYQYSYKNIDYFTGKYLARLSQMSVSKLYVYLRRYKILDTALHVKYKFNCINFAVYSKLSHLFKHLIEPGKGITGVYVSPLFTEDCCTQLLKKMCDDHIILKNISTRS